MSVNDKNNILIRFLHVSSRKLKIIRKLSIGTAVHFHMGNIFIPVSLKITIKLMKTNNLLSTIKKALHIEIPTSHSVATVVGITTLLEI